MVFSALASVICRAVAPFLLGWEEEKFPEKFWLELQTSWSIHISIISCVGRHAVLNVRNVIFGCVNRDVRIVKIVNMRFVSTFHLCQKRFSAIKKCIMKRHKTVNSGPLLVFFFLVRGLHAATENMASMISKYFLIYLFQNENWSLICKNNEILP